MKLEQLYKFKKSFYANGGASILSQSNIDVGGNPSLQAPTLGYKAENKSPFATESPIQTGGRGMLTDNMDLTDNTSKFDFNSIGGYASSAYGIYDSINKAAKLNQGNTVGVPKSQQIDANINAVDKTVNTALNYTGPVGTAVSTLRGVGDMVGKPIKESAEKRNPDGSLVDPDKAKTSAIIGSFFDPLKAITTRASYEGGWTDFSGDGYINAISPKVPVNYYKPNEIDRTMSYSAWGGNIYANGGKTGIYNMPKGFTHEQHPWGGYPVTNNDFVEEGEVVLDKPDGSKYIFSNRLNYK